MASESRGHVHQGVSVSTSVCTCPLVCVAPMPEARGDSREDQPHVQGALAARAQEGLEELSHVECGGDGQRSPWLADAPWQAPCAIEGENDLCGELVGSAKLGLVLV